MSDDDLEALREKTSHGDRIDEAETATAPDTATFTDDIVTELERIAHGDEQKTVSVWDGPMAAFIRALEQHPERMQQVNQALREQLETESVDTDPDADTEINRSELLRLSLQLGFETAAPEAVAAVRDAVEDHATRRFDP